MENAISAEKIASEMYLQPTAGVARALLGCVLVKREQDGTVLAGRIVETEAYLPKGDEANHAHKGETPRNAPMFAQGGVLYVYRIYGIHHCANIVTEQEGKGCAVLLRALEPLEGVDVMMRRRNTHVLRELCSGPGKIARALALTTAHNMVSVCGEEVYVLGAGAVPDSEVLITPRIGVGKAAELPLRFAVRDNLHVSRGQWYGKGRGS